MMILPLLTKVSFAIVYSDCMLTYDCPVVTYLVKFKPGLWQI